MRRRRTTTEQGPAGNRKLLLALIAVVLAAFCIPFLLRPDRDRLGGLAARDWAAALEVASVDARNPEYSEALIRALAAAMTLSGEEGLPVVFTLLRHRSPGVVTFTTRALELLDPAYVAVLRNSLSDEDPEIRGPTVRALAMVGPESLEVADRLLALSSDEDKGVRIQAIASLGVMKAGAARIVPALVRLLADPDGEVQGTAIGALGNLGAAAEDAVPALVAAASDPGARLDSVWAIGRIAKQPDLAVPHLVSLLADPDPRVGAAAQVALGKFGPDASAAIPALEAIVAEHANDPPSAEGVISRPAATIAVRKIHGLPATPAPFCPRAEEGR